MIFLELFWTFFKIGLFTFGGGYAMLPLIQSEALAHGWMDTADIVDFVAVSESTPGPFAVNIATYVGRVTAGVGGAVLPSFAVILLVARFYGKFRQSRGVEGAMTGLRPAVVGLIAAALLSVGREVFAAPPGAPWARTAVSAGIFVAMAVLAFRKKHPVLLIGLSAAIGVAAGYALGL